MQRPSPVASVVDSLALRGARYVFVIGGGGKTTLIAALARELSADRRVIATTSTRIRCAETVGVATPIVCEEIPALVAQLRGWLDDRGAVSVARRVLVGEDKLAGFSADDLDRLVDAGVADCLLVEADGSAGRSLKAHAAHEPVVSPRADLVIAVIGVDCIGRPLTDEHVHRAARLRALLGKSAGQLVSIDDVVAIFWHPEGYLRAVAPRAPVAVLLSRARGDAERALGRQLAQRLLTADRGQRISRVALGDLLATRALEVSGRAPPRGRA